MADLENRLVYEDRMKNIENTLKTVRDSGLVSGGWLFNLAVGFAQNNRKLIFGSDYGISKGNFEYPFPLSRRY